LRWRADRRWCEVWDEITLACYKRIIAEILAGKPTENMRIASKFFRDNGVRRDRRNARHRSVTTTRTSAPSM